MPIKSGQGNWLAGNRKAVWGEAMRDEAVAAELAVVGSCMAEANALREVMGFLGEEHFQEAKYRAIFGKMLSLARESKPYDVISIGTAFSKTELDGLGGMKFLFEVTNLVPSALNARHYAETMVKAHGLKKIVAAAKELTADPDAEAIQSAMRNALSGLQAMRGGEIVKMSVGLGQYLEMMDRRIIGMDTGFNAHFPELNRLTNGVGRGSLWVWGARTSRGKTSAMLRVAFRMASLGTKVLYVSAEMTAVELIDRIMAMKTGIALKTLRSKAVEAVKGRVVEEMGKLYTLPLIMSVGGKITMDRVMTEVDTHQPDVVIVDYLQRFMAPAGESGSRAAFFSDVANSLKALAMDRKIAVITASQLSRGVELRDDQTPTLADLKESGGIEEASDVVVLINVPHDGMDGIRRGEFIVAKHRNGPLGRFPVIFKEATTDFQEVEENEEVFP
jgi:replicative DNA helicase